MEVKARTRQGIDWFPPGPLSKRRSRVRRLHHGGPGPLTELGERRMGKIPGGGRAAPRGGARRGKASEVAAWCPLLDTAGPSLPRSSRPGGKTGRVETFKFSEELSLFNFCVYLPSSTLYSPDHTSHHQLIQQEH